MSADPRPADPRSPSTAKERAERDKLTGNGVCWITEAERIQIAAWIDAGGDPRGR